MLTGYWPVVGNAMALVSRTGRVGLLVPEDERMLAAGRADVTEWFAPSSLDHLHAPLEVAREPLRRIAASLGVVRGAIGFERDEAIEPSTYVSNQRYGAALPAFLTALLASATLTPADDLLARLRATLTPLEAECVRAACRVVGRAFLEGRAQLRAGARESATAAVFREPLGVLAIGERGIRAEGYVSCLSGPRSATAHSAYARSTARELATGDLVMVHCNSTIDGYWTDVTRTFSLGPPDEHRRAMYAAVFAARDAALALLRPGARAADVDAAAREALTARGFGPAFKHSTGHGVGFAAIDHLARPRLHPKSDDVLASGMIMNVEPAVYLDDCGLRHCDVVLCTDDGAEVLTPFMSGLADLTVTAPARPP
jgi:Xaa-Pro aminopeptidase